MYSITIQREIESITDTLLTTNKEQLKHAAERIATTYLREHQAADPITLARSSVFLALKNQVTDPESNTALITNNNGKINHWWVYLVPILEKCIANTRQLNEK
jgi:hypothetical protein